MNKKPHKEIYNYNSEMLVIVLARVAFSERQRNFVTMLLRIWGHLIVAAINK